MKPFAAVGRLLIAATLFRTGSRAALLVSPGSRSARALQQQVPGSLPWSDPLEDCFEVPGSICLGGDDGRAFILSSLHSLPDLVIWYQFDKSLPVDDSGHSHHLVNSDLRLSPLVAGPGIMGTGGSAAFDGRSYRVARDAAE